jgi:hypothetical protein
MNITQFSRILENFFLQDLGSMPSFLMFIFSFIQPEARAQVKKIHLHTPRYFTFKQPGAAHWPQDIKPDPVLILGLEYAQKSHILPVHYLSSSTLY